MICPGCGAPNPDSQRFCGTCERALANNDLEGGATVVGLARGHVLRERYELERPLGLGGMGQVMLPAVGSTITTALSGLTLQLDCDSRPDEFEAEATREFLRAQGVEGSADVGDCPVASVRITRVNNAPELEYCWLLNAVDIGSAPGCSIRIPGDGAPVRQASLLVMGDRFFLEAIGDGGSGVWVDELEMRGSDVFALGAAHWIRFGRQVCTWSAEAR